MAPVKKAARRKPTGKKRRKVGRPKVRLTALQLHQLRLMAGIGLTWPQIGACLEIATSTLKARKKDTPAVAEAYNQGKALAELGVGVALYKKAVAGDIAAIRWYEMTRGGRREGLSLAGARADDDEENRTFLPVEIRVID